MDVEELEEMFGIKIISGYGVKVVPQVLKEPKILEYNVVETTTPVKELVNSTKATILGRLKFFELFKKTCYKYKPPVIDFEIVPVKVKNVEFHWGGLYFKGDIVVKFYNKSKEGKEGVAKVWRWESCPSSEEAYDWKVVPGSADLLGSWGHKFWEDTNDIFIDSVDANTGDYVKKNNYVCVTAKWQTQNLGDTALTLWNILTSGKIVTRNGFDVTVSYDFNGTQQKTYHVDVKAVLPVEGNVKWFMW